MKKIVLIALSILAFASCKQEAPKKEIGIQLYSVRSLLKDYDANHEAVFAQLAEMGYTAVEAASFQADKGTFYGVAPEQFKADCEAAGLKCLSSHTGHNLSAEEIATGDISASLEWWAKAIPAHVAAGMEYIVIPSISIPSENVEATLKVYAEYFNAVGKMVNEAGMKFGYHNHSKEFEKREDIRFEDYMLENTDPAYVFFQMDVYWAVQGHVSPTAYFEKYPGRFQLLHIKDYREVGQGGCVGFDAIFNKVDVAGTEAIIVEMEGSSYDDILRTSKESAEYLINSDFVKF